jgi:hypothetical protein
MFELIGPWSKGSWPGYLRGTGDERGEKGEKSGLMERPLCCNFREFKLIDHSTILLRKKIEGSGSGRPVSGICSRAENGSFNLYASLSSLFLYLFTWITVLRANGDWGGVELRVIETGMNISPTLPSFHRLHRNEIHKNTNCHYRQTSTVLGTTVSSVFPSVS